MRWFRRAAPAHTSALLARTLVQIIVVWGLFLFVVPPFILAFERWLGISVRVFPYARTVSPVLFVAASSLGIASSLAMVISGRGTPLPLDGPSRLVVTGPYAWVRNPMALAGLAQGAAVALWHGSALLVVYVISGGVLWHVVVRPVEEADLREAFGDTYLHYRARVPLWLPRAPPRHDSS